MSVRSSIAPRNCWMPLAVIALSAPCFGQKIDVNWDQTQRVSSTVPTLQVVVNPPLRPGSPIKDRAYSEVRRLGADYVRYVPWLPYPKLGVAELEPPSNGKTSWDFTLIDPMTDDFMNATEGHSVILNFSTIPQWMWRTPKPVSYPEDPNQVTWDYTQGSELRDPSAKEVGDYYARLISWYVNGGFTDEYGKHHESGHHYKIPYWEILNEIDLEHKMTPALYTTIYDAVVTAVKPIAPEIKFVGLGVAMPTKHPELFEYFLNPANHKTGIPLDMISYHFYASPGADESPAVQQFTFFEQADQFIAAVRFIESIRKRYSPSTRTTVDEIGSISADDMVQGAPGHVAKPIPDSYWSLSGATYAYIFGQLALLGIDVAGESQLLGYPTQFPSVSMVDWNTGAANPRFRVLELLKKHFATGEKLAVTTSAVPTVFALGFIANNGEHKLFLVNKREQAVDLMLPHAARQVEFVDESTKSDPPATQNLTGDRYRLGAYGVAVVTLQ